MKILHQFLDDVWNKSTFEPLDICEQIIQESIKEFQQEYPGDYDIWYTISDGGLKFEVEFYNELHKTMLLLRWA